MKRKGFLTTFFVSFIACSLICIPTLISQDQEQGEQTFEADEGDKSIDVSKYPELMQEYYEVFFKKCSKCHTLARPINTDFTLDKWERYVKRMMRKPGSGITTSSGKKIFDFLKYYIEQKKEI